MRRKRGLLAGALGAGAVATAWTTKNYLEDKYATLALLRSGSQVIGTPLGVVEYACEGKGPPVLVIHGGGGGYDQGVLIADFIGQGFRWIAPSRFGYLRTPLPENATPEVQADIFPHLLDHLDLPAAVIIGMSAGGPSAVQFALRHPERCRGLALFSAINQPLPRKDLQYIGKLKGWDAYFPDFGLWLAVRTAGPRSVSWLVRSLEVNDSCDVDFVRAMQQSCLPMSERLAGTINDLIQAQALAPFPFEMISVPTLVIHGTADSLVPFSQAEDAASHIPAAEFIPLPGGSHLWMATHKGETLPTIRTFWTEHA